MKHDPRLRRDGRCAQCGGERKMPRTHHSSIPGWVYEFDPFCSTLCARAWHEVPLRDLSENPAEQRGKWERVAA